MYLMFIVSIWFPLQHVITDIEGILGTTVQNMDRKEEDEEDKDDDDSIIQDVD